jgi:type II secretory pathway predicted ATPase ExeA
VSTATDTAVRDPFGLTANPDGYYPTAAIERVLAEALAALAAGNVPVIAGPTGLGKTLVLQLIARAREPQARAIYVPYCTLPPADLARLALGLLAVEPGADPEAQLLSEAQRAARGGGSLLLLVDDAAALPGETAAQLASWLIASGGALHIVLAGLPGPALRHARDAFGDRAEDLVLMSGLRPEEIRGYVHSRLAAVGADEATRAAFDDTALAELARVSEGNPRRMNLAAQAIVRSVRAESAPARAPAPAAGAEAARAVARTTAQDLVSVGEYRFVRGRFVDPASGEARADAPEAVPHVERPMAPLEQRRRTVRRPAYTPPLEIDRTPGSPAEPDIEVDEHIPPAVVEPAPVAAVAPAAVARAPRRRASPGIPLVWIGAGIGLFAFAVGVWWQLGSDEDLPVARVTIEPMEIGKVAPADAAGASASGEASASGATGAAPGSSPGSAAPTASQPAAAEPAGATAPATPATPAAAEVPAVAPAAEVAAVEPPPAPPPDPTESPDASSAALEAPASPAPAAAPPAVEPPAPPPPPAELVAVAINAIPWAVIEVDGEEIGETPLAGIQLSVGRHRFRARMPDGSVREQVIRIDADTTTVVFD